MDKENEEVTIYLEDSGKDFWHHFWNIFWVIAVGLFIWSVVFDDGDVYAEEIPISYDDIVTNDVYPETEIIWIEEEPEFKIASKEELPISYSISNGCSDYMKTRIRQSFDAIHDETDSVLSFIEANDADIKIDCSLITGYTSHYLMSGVVGEATIGVIGYLSPESEISFYNFLDKYDAREMGACDDYFDLEIHEILHTFGFDHNSNRRSIMAAEGEGCYVDSIDDYVIDCLKYTYTNGENGTDCSDRDDVVGSLDDVEYEYEYEYVYEYEYDCGIGWYSAINSEMYCCPEPSMYIDVNGDCTY